MELQKIQTEEITQQISHLMNWQNGSITSMAQICPQNEAWRVGVQTNTAYRVEPAKVALILLTAIKRLIDYIQPKIGLNDQQLRMSVDWLLEMYPTTKIEEILHVIENMMKYGKYYERLQFPEIKSRIDEWLNSDQRITEIENYNLKLKPETRTGNNDIVDYAAYIERQKKKIEERKRANHVSLTQ